eukprot:NODE_798_length_4139_cov_0.212871.p3 type:complete len:108 gc:universal NODE_798_length_4139_cov_0.212871:3870-3547(-)
MVLGTFKSNLGTIKEVCSHIYLLYHDLVLNYEPFSFECGTKNGFTYLNVSKFNLLQVAFYFSSFIICNSSVGEKVFKYIVNRNMLSIFSFCCAHSVFSDSGIVSRPH